MNNFQKHSNEYDELSDNQQALYDEAVNCGAGHEDAMEATEVFKNPKEAAELLKNQTNKYHQEEEQK